MDRNIAACTIRVPVEIAKQRRQALGSRIDKNAFEILLSAYKEEGLRKGVYRGFYTTIWGLFSGLIPRVLWITIGGAIFFGFYDFTNQFLKSNDL